MNRLIVLAALMLSMIAGLTIMSGSAPLSAQGSPSAIRSIDLSNVQPGETVTVTVAVTVPQPATGVAISRLSEQLPAGFGYVADSASPALALDEANGLLVFNLLGTSASVTYQATASSVEQGHDFSGTLTIREGDAAGDYDVTGDTTVTVATDAPPPPAPDLELPNLDSGAAGLFSAPADSGNDVSYTARDTATTIRTRRSPSELALMQRR